MSSLRILVLVALPLLSLLGFYNTFHTARLNGTGALLSSTLNGGSTATLPGSDAPLLREYTHIRVLDETITLLVAFFAPVVDGSLDGYSRWALGQFGAAWAVIVMEGLRRGNRGRIVSWTGIFGLSLQLLSFTVITPIYLFIHLLTSPAAPAQPSHEALLTEPHHLTALPYTIAISYLLPSLAMGLESTFVSAQTHQRLIALWQFFPALTTVVHYSIICFLKHPRFSKLQGHQTATFNHSKAKRQYLTQLKTVQKTLSIFCTLMQQLSFSPSLNNGYFQRRFVPFSLIHGPYAKVPSLAVGVKNFLQWDIYIGCLSLLIWAALLYYETQQQLAIPTQGRRSLIDNKILLMVALAMVSGPIGVVVWLFAERDKLILESADENRHERAS